MEIVSAVFGLYEKEYLVDIVQLDSEQFSGINDRVRYSVVIEVVVLVVVTRVVPAISEDELE